MGIPFAAAVKQSASAAGWYRRRLSRDTFPGVAVLCYHGVLPARPTGTMPFEGLHVTAADLNEHCAVIRDTCHPISLDEWRGALAGRGALPARPILLTFDDGYRNVYTTARPILEAHEVPAVMFICTTPVARRQAFWYDTLALEAGEAAVESAKSTAADGWESLLGRLARPVADEAPHAPMHPGEVAALAAHRLFEIGSHSASHPILAALERERQREEIEGSIRELSTWTGRTVRSFAYPNGRPGVDFTAETEAIVAQAGIDFAFTTSPGFARRDADRLRSRRFLMTRGISGAELTHRLAYSWRQ